MVKIKESSEFEQLEKLLEQLCSKHDLKLFVNGWTRKTYDIYKGEKRLSHAEHVARIESLVVSNGEVRYFSDDVLEFVKELGEMLEKTFKIPEAIIIKEKKPEY